MTRVAHAATAIIALLTVLCSQGSTATTPRVSTAKPRSALSTSTPSAASMAFSPKLDLAAGNMLYATGEGAMPTAKEEPNRAKAYLQAKAYAKMCAIASLAQAAKGTLISYCSTGKGYAADALIKQEVKGVLECVQVVGWRKRSEGKDTIVEVTVRAPKPAPPKAPPVVEKAVADVRYSAPSWVRTGGAGPSNEGRYTSLIIDAQGLGVAKCMSPKILRGDGSEIWGTVKADSEFVCEYGIAAYARTRAEAFANRRAGINPLVIRASARGRSVSKGDVVISDADADRILAEDANAGFLADYRVIIITGR